jgi:hypothetical protein
MQPRFSHPQPGRRYRKRFAYAAVLAAAVACGPSVEVRTAVSPEAAVLSTRRTFAVVEAKSEEDGNGFGINDPMIDNQITSRAMHDQIVTTFEAKGYRYTTKNPDFVIRYQASLAPILDIWTNGTMGSGYYGFRGRYGYDAYGYADPYWAGDFGYGHAVASYDRSQVIIDAVDPGSGKLLWRGEGTSDRYAEPKKYMKEIRRAVNAVAKKFPSGNGNNALVVSR